MKNFMNSVQLRKPKKNWFDLGHDVKMSGLMGNLMPTCAIECLPGETYKIGCNSLIRFAPMLAPIMHRVNVSMHYFFVPNRLVWPGWEGFITGSTSPVRTFPTIPIDSTLTADQKKFLDYFGVPPLTGANSMSISAIPFAAYQLIYDQYYRDQNLIAQDATSFSLGDGSNAGAIAQLLTMRKRAFEHDYFTSALPSSQKGAAVDIPLGDVTLKDNWDTVIEDGHLPTYRDVSGAALTPGNLQLVDNPPSNPYIGVDSDPGVQGAYDPAHTLEVEPVTINTLRRAFRLQEFLERMMVGGSRLTEVIWSMFGVKSPDARLQRAEYITGIKSPVIISEVLNTTGTEDAPQGDMAGHGVAGTSGKYGFYTTQEHGYIIGVMSVMPKTAYQDGVAKHFIKNDYLDFGWNQFAHLGEQEVKGMEVYANTTGVNQLSTFGYQPRFAEYRHINSRVAGDFRTTLDYWHLGRKFTSFPTLSQDFIEADPADFSRIFAVETGDNLWMHIYHDISALRPLPKYGTPTL